MVAQIFLVTDEHAYRPEFGATLSSVLADGQVSALLIRRADRTAADYAALLEKLVPLAQSAGTAVLVEDDVALAVGVGADGVHVGGDVGAISAALKVLKPKGIVGAGPIASRHDAMTIGETDVDYLFFGPLSEPADPDAIEMAAWWAETFEVPAVLSGHMDGDAAGCEFLALGTAFWQLADPAGSLRAAATTDIEA